ncbi:MAG: hypothetical protein RBT67_07310 [Thauera sp.]|jgi:general secretion pathway protein N|nr:hypothetical protein [Thauera sp.]
MMHRTFGVLLGLSALLLAGIAALWLDQAAWQWQVPAPIAPVLVEPGGQQGGGDIGAADFPHTLERPLFNASRRPPPPAQAAPAASTPQAEAAPADSMRLHALMQDDAGKGVALVSFNGKMQRVRLGEALGGWRLEAIAGREARFVAGEGADQMRSLLLPRPGEPAAVSKTPQAPAAADASATPAARPSTPGYQTAADRVRERILRNNALRVQNGLEPEPLPPE